MMKPKVWVSGPVSDGELDRLREIADVEMRPEPEKALPEHTVTRVPGVAAIIPVNGARITPEVLDAAGPTLKVVANFAVGYDNVDVAAATARGIPVTNTPDVLVEATADIAFGLIIAAGRRFAEGQAAALEGRWQWAQALMWGQQVSGATHGILGMGRIGAAVARRGRGFEMHVLYHSRNRKEELEVALDCEYVSYEELLERSDFLSLHCALTPDTRHILNAEALSRMKKTAVVVNTGRGGLVEQAALVEAVREGRLAGAGLDVTDPEPPDPSDAVLHTPGIYVLPHIGSASHTARAAMTRVAVDNVIAVLTGKTPPTCINPEVLG
jgi:glyoxylate reductase